MATTITINPQSKPTTAQLVTLTTQMAMQENQGGSSGLAAMAAVRASYLRACELWPASMHIAAAIVALTNASFGGGATFTASTTDATIDALNELTTPAP